MVIIRDMVHGRRRSMISNATNCIASACNSVFSHVYVDWKTVSHANKTAWVYHNQENFPMGLPFLHVQNASVALPTLTPCFTKTPGHEEIRVATHH